MKRILVTEPGKVKLEEISQPTIKTGEVLVKVLFVGLCGSDLSSYLGKNPMVNYPVTPGHEIAAEIVELGEAVPEQFFVGQLITLNPYTNCGTCPSCKQGRVNACQFNETMGVQRNGALSEYFALPWEKILAADGLNPVECALTEPLSVGFHAVSRGRVTETDLVTVLGCGMIGAGAIIGSRSRGATVVAVDVDDSKLETAQKLGANFTINTSREDLNQRLSEQSKGQGPDVVIEAAGNPVTYLAAVDEVAFCGRIVCIGYAKSDIAFATKKFVQKELDILGSRNALQADFQMVMDYLKKKECPTDLLITQIVSMEETGKALAKWAENPGKVMKILVSLSS